MTRVLYSKLLRIHLDIYLAALPLGMGTQYWPTGEYTVRTL